MLHHPRIGVDGRKRPAILGPPAAEEETGSADFRRDGHGKPTPQCKRRFKVAFSDLRTRWHSVEPFHRRPSNVDPPAPGRISEFMARRTPIIMAQRRRVL